MNLFLLNRHIWTVGEWVNWRHGVWPPLIQKYIQKYIQCIKVGGSNESRVMRLVFSLMVGYHSTIINLRGGQWVGGGVTQALPAIIKRSIEKKVGIKHEYVNAVWSWCSSDYYTGDKTFLTAARVCWSLTKTSGLLIEKCLRVSLRCSALSEVNN